MSKYEMLEEFKGVLGYVSDKVNSINEKHKSYETVSEKVNKNKEQDDRSYTEGEQDDKICENQNDSCVEALKVNELDQKETCLIIDFKEDNVMQAFVNSEIFGKPKARTRRRR